MIFRKDGDNNLSQNEVDFWYQYHCQQLSENVSCQVANRLYYRDIPVNSCDELTPISANKSFVGQKYVFVQYLYFFLIVMYGSIIISDKRSYIQPKVLEQTNQKLQ